MEAYFEENVSDSSTCSLVLDLIRVRLEERSSLRGSEGDFALLRMAQPVAVP